MEIFFEEIWFYNIWFYLKKVSGLLFVPLNNDKFLLLFILDLNVEISLSDSTLLLLPFF